MSVTTVAGPAVESNSTGILVGLILLVFCLLVLAALAGNIAVLAHKYLVKIQTDGKI
jgi:hypothetical protein